MAWEPAAADSRDQARAGRGRAVALAHCSPCHAIGKNDASPTRANADTAFRDLHKRFPVKMLTDASATGILAGHDEMPMFDFSRPVMQDLLAYLDS
ncbi:MAG TPA: cytochrome c, partial [Hyphomicrobiaceae bacterium]|nr:cytochrome c [Hyphomicrobiaceae bacterium]